MKLLIATTNPGKLAEIKQFLSEVSLELISLQDLGIADVVEETGNTFEENAVLKAKYYAALSGLPTLADDGGFEIDALGGEPGVKSHRWIDQTKDSSDEDLIAYTLVRMKDIPEDKRTAQLRLVLALVLPNGQQYLAEEKIRGIVPLHPVGKRSVGFPFRSLLYLPELHKYYNHDELTQEENTRYNHRKKALEKLKPKLKELLQGEKK